MLRALLHRLRIVVWERRLTHARACRGAIEAEMRREVLKAQHDLEHCELMVSRARMASVEARANKRLRRRFA